MSGNFGAKLFYGYKPLTEKLLSFGFEKTEGGFSYIKGFLGGQFRLEITVSFGGEIALRVVEVEFEEEYAPINVESFNGGFVGEVRNIVTDILLSVRDACFIKTAFIGAQANRIAALIAERYGEFADYPFEGDDISGVFRYKPTGKWYALVMNIRRNKLLPCDNSLFVDVVNLKCDENARDTVLAINGVFPAYHMNKQKWISVLLDDSLSDDAVMALIDVSRNLVGKIKPE